VDWEALSEFLIAYRGEDGTPRFTMGLYHSSTLAWMGGLLASLDPQDLHRQWEMVMGCAEIYVREAGGLHQPLPRPGSFLPGACA
jgi:hypothetical protein